MKPAQRAPGDRAKAGPLQKCRAGRRCWTALPDGGHYPFQLRARKAEVLLLVGRWMELEEQYRLDLEKAEAAGLRQHQAVLLMERGELQGWRNEHGQAAASLERAARMYGELGDAPGRLRCENGLAVVSINVREYDKAEALITSSTGQARRLGLKNALCSSLNSHAVLCRERKQIGRAIAYLEERMAVSQEMGSFSDVASSHMNIAVLLTENGQYAMALRHNETALELSHKSGDIVQQEFALYNQAQILRKLGRGEECLDCLQKALAVSRHLGDEPIMQCAVNDIARVKQALVDNSRIEEL